MDMKYYKDDKNNVFGYAKDGSQDEFIPADYTAITDAEADAILNPSLTTAEKVAIAKTAKLTEIEDDFTQAESQSVTYLGADFIGGQDSVQSIDGYVRLVQLAGGTTFTIWDAQGADHNFTEAEVSGLILAIGGQTSINKFTKKDRKVALAAATTVNEVNDV